MQQKYEADQFCKQPENLEEGTSCEKPPVDQNQEGKIEPKIEQNIEPGASNKKQKDIRSFLQEVNEVRSPNNDVIGPVQSPVIEEQEEQEETICEIKKGQCLDHKKEAVKKTISSKKWGKKKDGLSGWIYSKRVRGFCPAKMTPEAPSFASRKSCPSSSTAPVFNNMGVRESFLGINKSHNNGEEGERLDLSESVEDRIIKS